MDMTSDVDMAEVDNKDISETPHSTINMNSRASHGSYPSADSGYFAFTPQLASASTPIAPGCRTRMCLASSKRHYRLRSDPWQSDRAPRPQSKFNYLISASDRTCDSLIDESQQISASGVSHDSGNFSCENPSSVERNSSLENAGLGFDARDFRAEMRKRRSRTRRAFRSTAPVTPASALELPSQPPSPAVPSSSFVASEPIDEDAEMKLVIVPQSTPYPQLDSPRSNKSLRSVCLNYSPTTSRTSPANIGLVDNQKLSKLKITDNLACIPEIKPKRLDFSQRALSYGLHRTRATPDFTGKDTVDLISLLGEKSNHWRVVSKILSHLGPQDLCSISMVSKVWRRICVNDWRANVRRLNHIMHRQSAKENLKLIRKSKIEAATQMSPKSKYARKGHLIQVQNLLQVPTSRRPPNSPPVSPSKIKFHSFVKASRTLEPWEHLVPCPNCSFPCHVDEEKNVGKCSRQGCSMEFCISCSSKPHGGACKTLLLATPTKQRKPLIAGSKQSKKNLRRLLL